MKAIQIKYVSQTDTMPSRLRAWAESCIKMDEVLDYGVEIEKQAEGLAMRYMVEMGWNENCTLTGFGVLPCGDWVATLG